MLLDKAKVKQSFAAAALTYDSVAHLQRAVGTALLQVVDLTEQSGTLLDIGCGTGFLTHELLTRSNAQHIIALDMALTMLDATRQKLGNGVHYVCADAETLPLATHCVDSVFSNLALQWCSDLRAVLTDIRRVLKANGQLALTTFGTDTLCELKRAWATVDNYQHVNDFLSEQAVVNAVRQAGFRTVYSHRQLYTPRYDSVQTLMRELKHIGAHNILAGRNKQLTRKSTLQAMIAAYPVDACNSISATFEVITVCATR